MIQGKRPEQNSLTRNIEHQQKPQSNNIDHKILTVLKYHKRNCSLTMLY